jgi:pyridoxine 5-phosphate synthase
MNTIPAQSIKLGVNIDHVATLRNARGENDPSLIEMAMLTQNAGADLITVHLREDRRHIQDADIFELKKNLKIPLNFEMALSEEILKIALDLQPATVCLVPERREEITTEGGLNVQKYASVVASYVEQLQTRGIEVHLFIEPDLETVKAAAASGAKGIEFHTGAYARAFNHLPRRRHEISRIAAAADAAVALELEVHAGHGLNYFNVAELAQIHAIREMNIGHAIIARSLAIGLPQAIEDMRFTMRR